MQKLIEGIVKFKNQDFLEHKELFSSLKRQQKPHTLFISCSDSRVDPNMLTKTVPGELFVVRNIANIVPPYRKTHEYLATTSAIEYAVNVLEVENIVVCGHSNCGGCAAIYMPNQSLQHIPHTQRWLELAENVKRKVLTELSHNDDEPAKSWMTEQTNVIEQLLHLFSYPFIKDKYENEQININGWYYIIETGEVYIYDKISGEFNLAN